MGTKEVRANLQNRQPRSLKKTSESPKFNADYLRGVGSALKYITKTEYHASGCGGCHTTAIELDKLAPDEILTRLDEFAEKLHQNAQAKSWNKLLDFVAFHIYGLEKHKDLIRRAVILHIEETTRKAGLTDS